MKAANPYCRKLHRLAAQWRGEAESLRTRGMDREARMVESFADDLESEVREMEDETLTLEEAADESGLSYSSVQHKVAAGEIPNAGEKGSPRVRRGDLPRIAQRPQRGPELHDDDLADEVLLARRSGGR